MLSDTTSIQIETAVLKSYDFRDVYISRIVMTRDSAGPQVLLTPGSFTWDLGMPPVSFSSDEPLSQMQGPWFCQSSPLTWESSTL